MPNDNIMTVIMLTSVAFQFAAALMAMRLIRVSGVITAWMMLAFGLLFMAGRRLMILIFILMKAPVSTLSFEILGLLISILMFSGIFLIKPLFIRIIRQKEELLSSKKALEELNCSLEKRVNEAIAENLEKDRLLMMKGREAAMGEMIRNIAHQWKQPLNGLGLSIQEMQYAWLDKSMTAEQMEKSVEYSMSLIKHMSHTIDDFTNFFNPGKAIKNFSIKDSALRAKSFVNSMCIKRGISISVETDEDTVLNGPENELVQVLMNLFQNSAEALAASEKKDKFITASISRKNGKAVITVSDNAGGIATEMLGTLFDAYSTSKEHGSGIGLYMSKMIIRNTFHGEITAANNFEGAEFRIEI